MLVLLVVEQVKIAEARLVLSVMERANVQKMTTRKSLQKVLLKWWILRQKEKKPRGINAPMGIDLGRIAMNLTSATPVPNGTIVSTLSKN